MKNILLLGFFTFLLIGCNSDDESNNQIDGIDYLIPLKLGNKWEFYSKRYNADGTIKGIESQTFKVTESVNRGGNEFFRIPLSTNDNLSFNLRNQDVNNVQGFSSSDEGMTEIYSAFKRVSTNGEVISEFTDNSGNHKLIGYKDIYIINGYECIKNISIESNLSGDIWNKTIYYLSPGIGWIRIENYSFDFYSNELYLFEELDLLGHILY